MVMYYDPAIYGDTPIDDEYGYDGRLYVSKDDYTALEARVAELERDAARYRWMRDSDGLTLTAFDLSHEELDSFVDSMMADEA